MFRLADYKLRRFAWWRKLVGAPEPMVLGLSEITRMALREMHEKVAAINSIGRELGMSESRDALTIRRPVQYSEKVSNG